jgi:hypothetical protein
MTDVDPALLRKPAKTKQRKLVDILATVVFIIIALVLARALLHQLNLKNEVKAATAVTDQVISHVKQHDGAAVRKQGDKIFQQQNSAANLTAQFTAASKYTASTPVIERKTVTNESDQQSVSIIYKFSNPTFFIRTIVVKTDDSNKFELVNLKGDLNAAPLLDNKY